MGIEPTSKAWEAFVLPLNYTRKKTWLAKILQSDGMNSHGCKVEKRYTEPSPVKLLAIRIRY